MTEQTNNSPIISVPGGTPLPPQAPIERDPLFGGRAFKRKILTFVTLFILTAIPVSNLMLDADPAELLRELGKNPLYFYIVTIISLWMIFGLTFVSTIFENQSLTGLGLGKLRGIHFLQAIAFFMVSMLILKGLETALSEMGYLPVGELELILPKNWSERFWWILLSVSAGFCEEIAFRGYFMTRVWHMSSNDWTRRMRWVPGIILSTIVFGLGHTYEGVSGVTLITSYGLMISFLFLMTRSLWPCIIAHFLLDFIHIFIPLLES